jgi:hypothetical protein
MTLGLAILEDDCLELLTLVSDAVTALPSKGKTSAGYLQCKTRVIQHLRRSIFPGDSASRGNFIENGPYVFQRGRYDALKGKH